MPVKLNLTQIEFQKGTIQEKKGPATQQKSVEVAKFHFDVISAKNVEVTKIVAVALWNQDLAESQALALQSLAEFGDQLRQAASPKP